MHNIIIISSCASSLKIHFSYCCAFYLRYWYLGPLKIKAAHWFSTLRVRNMTVSIQSPWTAVVPPCICTMLSSCICQEWPQVHEASVSYMAPTLRPPDLPEQKPPRPNLMYRIARRLKNYWYPPIPGNTIFVLVFVCLSVHNTTSFKCPCVSSI